MGIKRNCYVFDFAPDRALKIMSESIGLTSKKGKINTAEQKEKMAKMLNFFPIIGQSGNMMIEFSVDRMLTQLKKAFAEKAVRSGFEDNSLYNENLMGLGEEDLSDFKNLKAIVGTSTATKKDLEVVITKNGFSDEEHEMAEKAERKPKRQRTPEEQEALDKLKQLRKQKSAMISILRGVSIRIPMMIYGMQVDLEEEISVNKFIKLVDDQSWEEFMPKGLTKAMFKKFTRYYDNEVFIEAGRIIRNKAKSYDKLDVIERTEKIAELFSTFKNPDKETVLTPWRVVNLQLISTFGGLSFYDKDFINTTIDGKSALCWVGEEKMNQVYKQDIKILDINSKTGLYPLFMATSLYYQLMQQENEKNAGKFDPLLIWKRVLKENIYAIAKTPMAKTITERTLTGYQSYETNVEFIDLIPLIRANDDVSDYIERAFNKVNFDVIIGNPPYQEMDGGAQASASPVYPDFIKAAKSMNPNHISLIIPSRWYSGGKGLDAFRDDMLNDPHLRELHDWLTPENIFPNTNIRGGVCYFLWEKAYNNKSHLTRVITYENNKVISDVYRPMKFGEIDIFIRDSKSIKILEKISHIQKELYSNLWIDQYVSSRKPFGLDSAFTRNDKFKDNAENLVNPVKCYGVKGLTGYVERDLLKVKEDWIEKWKVFTAYANNIGTELNDDNFNTIIGLPGTICTETYLVIGADLNLNETSTKNLSSYLKTKFSRYLQSLAKSNQHGTRKTYRLIPLQDYSENSDIDWTVSTSEIDVQLYKKYKLTSEEIFHIESRIKPMQ